MPLAPVTVFLRQVEALLKSGNATEHSYRPALVQLFNTVLAPAHAINEPQHAKYGAPDFVIQQESSPIGHAEAKDVGIDLTPIIKDSEKPNPSTANGRQLKRYRAALPNLLYTDGLEWHWFVDGQPRQTQPVIIGVWNKTSKKVQPNADSESELTTLLRQFGAHDALTISTPRDLAQRLAQIARWLRDVIVEIFASQDEEGPLHQQLKAFRATLLPTLTPVEFADMYAQTLVYGLFAARVAQQTNKTFTRFDAGQLIPKTNPFLRRLFREVADDDLDERVAWIVDDCARLLGHTDMSAVMQDFGRATRREDPVVHFYETFLAAYDPKMREARGVYYTPEPVVSYIVRSVDTLLKTRFGKTTGLADEQTIILDPATGTATFLHAVVQQIYMTLADQGMAGTWNTYVQQRLLPRLFGFELLMAPYTVAHLKMGLLLAELGYTFASNERLGIFLTNTLDDVKRGQQLAFAEFIAAESQLASEVKHNKPVMVVLGNPPYSNFGMLNKSDWIRELLEDYKKDLDEKKINLDDDFIKFIRFGQWRIEQSGAGILAFITNNTYIEGITHRRMRQSLMKTFSDIFVLNLHGSAKKREKSPDGSKDENVFDIQQGVAITIFVKEFGNSKAAAVHHAEVWGLRESKYDYLSANDVTTTEWNTLNPIGNNYFFTPVPGTSEDSYSASYSINGVVREIISGIQTKKDNLFVGFTSTEVERRMKAFLDPSLRSHDGELKSFLSEADKWIEDKAEGISFSSSHVRDYMVSPFNMRRIYYHPRLLGRSRYTTMRHMLEPNIGLVFMRQSSNQGEYNHFFAVNSLITDRVFYSAHGAPFLFPLYLYPNMEAQNGSGRQASLLDAEAETKSSEPNLSPSFIVTMGKQLNLRFLHTGRGDLQQTVGPEDVFHYAYAIFHSPT